MSDPYRPSYTETTTYPSQDQYRSSYRPEYNNQHPSHQHELQLSQSRASPLESRPSEPYYPPGGGGRSRSGSHSNFSNQHHHHQHSPSPRSRSRSRRDSSAHHRRRDGDDDETYRSDDSDAKSPRHRDGGGKIGKKQALGVVAGAGAGGLLGHELLGGGALGTVSGMLVGAIGAQALERRHERNKKTRRASFGDGGDEGRGDRKEGLRDRIGNLLAVPGHGDEEKKRSRSHTDEGRRHRSKKEGTYDSDSEDERGRWRRY